MVPGIGPADAKLFIVGEAPGEDEDIIGEPFVGIAGKLLDKLMAAAGLERSSCYITNIVKCRPYRSVTPPSVAIQACKPWLWEELKLIGPKVVVTLGKPATSLLLRLPSTFTMKSVVGNVYNMSYTSAKIMPWYHPSYFLQRGSTWDASTIEFFKKVIEELNV